MCALYKTTYWVSLLYQLSELCHSVNLNSECAEASPVSLTHSHFKTILQLKLSYWLIALSSRRPEQLKTKAKASPGATGKWSFHGHLAITTIISIQSSCVLIEWLAAQCLPETWTMSMQRQGFQVSPTNGLFKTIFSLKLSYQLKAQPPWDLNN